MVTRVNNLRNRSFSIHSCRYLLITLVAVQLSGCYLHRIADFESGYGYVIAKGGPREITEWALAQNEERAIDDAIFALAEMKNDRDAYISDEAARGQMKIGSKMGRGWVGIVPRDKSILLGSIEYRQYYEDLRIRGFSVVSSFGNRFKAEYDAIEPSIEEGRVHQSWKELRNVRMSSEQ